MLIAGIVLSPILSLFGFCAIWGFIVPNFLGFDLFSQIDNGVDPSDYIFLLVGLLPAIIVGIIKFYNACDGGEFVVAIFKTFITAVLTNVILYLALILVGLVMEVAKYGFFVAIVVGVLSAPPVIWISVRLID